MRGYPQLFATNDEAMFSGRLDRYYRWAAWAVVTVFFDCLYVLYCSYLTLIGRTTPLEHLSVRIILGTIGAIGALGGILLSKAMWAYWRQDRASNASNRFWFFIMTFVPLFGCAAYYFFVYRNRAGS
jgi:nitrate/nitrite transporter NarK